jgi:predicted dehydrogenase
LLIKRKRKFLAIIGGGRWAIIYLKVLSTIDLAYEIAVVTHFGKEKVLLFCNKNNINAHVTSSLDSLLKNNNVVAAIIVNAARNHLSTAIQLLDYGANVLIEKPLALHEKDVIALYRKAKCRNLHIVPALTFSSCSYLDNFLKEIQKKTVPVIDISIKWQDKKSEIRYGENKSYDPSISVAQDVMPHIWAILRSILPSPNTDMELINCSILNGGRKVSYEIRASDTFCKVLIEREALNRKRYISARLLNGETIEIDFTVEPGEISVRSEIICADSDWNTKTVRPIHRELEKFLNQAKQPLLSDYYKNRSIMSVSLAERADVLLKCKQEKWLLEVPFDRIDSDFVYAITELLCAKLYNQKKIKPGDHLSLKRMIKKTLEATEASNTLDLLRELDIGERKRTSF